MKKKEIEKLVLTKKKKYKLPNYTFGVEIECYNASSNLLAYKLHEAGIKVRGSMVSASVRDLMGVPAGNRINRTIYWDIGDDGSITGRDSMEIRSPILRGEKGIEEIKTVCKVLNDLKIKTNSSCGLHVHVGIKNSKKKFNVKQILKIMQVYEENSKTIDRWVKAGRRTGRNGYAESVKDFIKNATAETEKVRDVKWVQDGFGSGRYETITKIVKRRLPQTLTALARKADHFDRVNFSAYTKHGTIEFRQHHGTVNGEEITNWVRFLLNHIENAREVFSLEKKQKKVEKKPVVINKINPLLGLPPVVQQHFKERIRKYRSAQAA